MKSAAVDVTWTGDDTYTLTGSYVASDPIDIVYANRFTLYPYYTAGAAEAGNTVSITVEVNPYTASQDAAGVYWGQAAGQYVNSSGTYTEEAATYNVAQGSAGVLRAGEPLEVLYPAYARIRFKVKENGVAANAGTLKLTLVKSDNV